jgi:esterase/lipase superfamily enzyme
MPTPNLYAGAGVNPFVEVPPELQNNHVDVIYLTDRGPEGAQGANAAYGFRRSRSVAYGVARVEFGKDVSWSELVKASRTSDRPADLPVTVASTKELGRFPQTPRTLLRIQQVTTQPTPIPEPAVTAASRTSPTTLPWLMLGDDPDAEQLAAEDGLRREISAQMALTPVKEVYLFVHGYNNDFDYSIQTIAQLWHFFGREGVPIAYSWPAGSGGLLRGYTYDRESSEFTVFHLKQMIRVIASCPDVKKINIISHSRGTDVTISALRELHMEITGSGRSTRYMLKLGTVVLAAPDIDLDVVIQKFMTVHLGLVPERFAMYVCSEDKALGLSNWLFSGAERLGQLKADLFTPEELHTLRMSKTVQIIDARITNAGAFGHDYFHSNPAVSSDLILLMRYHLPPGAQYGRPLRIADKGFWVIDDSYPAMEASAIASDKPGKN